MSERFEADFSRQYRLGVNAAPLLGFAAAVVASYLAGFDLMTSGIWTLAVTLALISQRWIMLGVSYELRTPPPDHCPRPLSPPYPLGRDRGHAPCPSPPVRRRWLLPRALRRRGGRDRPSPWRALHPRARPLCATRPFRLGAAARQQPNTPSRGRRRCVAAAPPGSSAGCRRRSPSPARSSSRPRPSRAGSGSRCRGPTRGSPGTAARARTRRARRRQSRPRAAPRQAPPRRRSPRARC